MNLVISIRGSLFEIFVDRGRFLGHSEFSSKHGVSPEFSIKNILRKKKIPIKSDFHFNYKSLNKRLRPRKISFLRDCLSFILGGKKNRKKYIDYHFPISSHEKTWFLFEVFFVIFKFNHLCRSKESRILMK